MVKVAETGGKVPALVVKVTVLVSVTFGVVIVNVASVSPGAHDGCVNTTSGSSHVTNIVVNPAIAGALNVILPVATCPPNTEFGVAVAEVNLLQAERPHKLPIFPQRHDGEVAQVCTGFRDNFFPESPYLHIS